MLVNDVRTSIVMMSNKGFGGENLKQDMAGAVKKLAANEVLRSAKNEYVAEAVSNMMPGKTAMAAENAQQVSAASTPSAGKTNMDKGLQ